MLMMIIDDVSEEDDEVSEEVGVSDDYDQSVDEVETELVTLL